MANIPNPDRRRRASNQNYDYGLDRNGSLEIGRGDDMVMAPVRIGYGNHIPQSHSYALSLDHPNYLGLKFVHIGGNLRNVRAGGRGRADVDPNAGADIKVHIQPAHTYHTYLYRLQRSRINPVMTFGINGETATYRHVPKEYRLLVRGAVKLLLHIHSQNRALICQNLSLDNLQIGHGDELKMDGVDFMIVDNGNPDIHFRNDWRHLRELLTSSVFNGYVLPEDMTALLICMDSYASSDDERFMKNHLAIMSPGERVEFFRNAWDKQDSIRSRFMLAGLYTTSLQDMGNNMLWTNGFGNPPNAPLFSAVSRCYADGVRRRIIYDDSTSEKGNSSLIRCARNVATHLPQHFNLPGVISAFGDIQMDNMLMATFGHAMTGFHRELAARDLVKLIVSNPE